MTTTNWPPGVLDEIKALFSWNPPRLFYKKPCTASAASTTTRLSSFYDRHFSNKSVLKRVERLPSLVQDLANNVDRSLDALTTPPSLNGLITAEQRADDINNLYEVMTDEKAVANIYHLTTARYCLPVASTLALHPSASFSRWRNLLFWTQSGPSSSNALRDGLLRFVGEGFDQTKNMQRVVIMETMETNQRRIFEEMGKSMSALATWEIRSASASPVDEVMNAVLNLGNFSWTFCTAHDYFSDPKHRKAEKDVEAVAVGPDAQATPWNFPNDFLNASLVPENRDKEIERQPLATLQWPVIQPVTRSVTSGFSTLPPIQPSASCSSETRSSTKVKGKKRKRDDETYQSWNDKIAQHLVQQAWAQAVRVDGTIIVLHSGNHELVCVRHRGSQTLYVSDIIEPPTCVDPGYGKLHVGIYIAAVQDTMDRKQQQLSPIPQPKFPGDQDDQNHNRDSRSCHKGGHARRVGRCRGGHRVGKRTSGRFQGSAEKKVPADELVAIEKTIHVASNRDVVLLYLQYDVYDSPTPASFVRASPSIIAHTRCPTPPFSPRAIRTCGLKECLTIVLTSEIGRGATGVVHRGTLKPEVCDGAIPLDVVVKLAFDIEQRDALRSEYEVYRRLRSKGILRGIPTVLGLFDDSEDGACALVMLYSGVPLVKKPQRILSVSVRESVLSTLESIHRAGILHGDIRRENVLMGDSGVTIIDFGHSEQCDDQKAKDKEFARLRYLLGLTPESD